MGELLVGLLFLGVISLVVAFLAVRFGPGTNMLLSALFIFKTLIVGLLVALVSYALLEGVAREIVWQVPENLGGFYWVRTDELIAATAGAAVGWIIGWVLLKIERVLGRLGSTIYQPKSTRQPAPLTILKGIEGWLVSLLAVASFNVVSLMGEPHPITPGESVFNAVAWGAGITYLISRIHVWLQSGGDTLTG